MLLACVVHETFDLLGRRLIIRVGSHSENSTEARVRVRRSAVQDVPAGKCADKSRTNELLAPFANLAALPLTSASRRSFGVGGGT